jgi:hypothetical protein
MPVEALADVGSQVIAHIDGATDVMKAHAGILPQPSVVREWVKRDWFWGPLKTVE